MSFRPGEIYRCYDPGAPKDIHRVLVVSRDELNRGDYVVTVRFTSKRLEERTRQANCVFFPAGSQRGLDADCVMQGESIAMTPWREFDLQDPRPLGLLSEEWMEKVIEAIGYVMDASCFRQL